jgi:hypothetical protein
MNNKNLDALFTGLTGTVKSSSEGQDVMEKQAQTSNLTVPTEIQSRKKPAEERFCTIVQSDSLRKIRIIANREGLQIKEVVNAAFNKAIKSYERKHGSVDGAMKGDASNLF